jgi:hypothetical protein
VSGRGPILVAGALGAWLWACVAANHPVPGFDRVHERAGGLDVWLPRWRFFAPDPVSWDVVLRYRLDDGDWRDVPVERDHAWTALLVNPGRRRRKALTQIGRSVAGRAAAHGTDADDWRYRLLVAHVVEELRRRDLLRDAATVRFALVEDPGHDTARRARLLYESTGIPT